MKFAFRGVSGAALLFGLSGGLQAAWAQQPTTPAPGPQNQTVTTAQPQGPAPQAAQGADQTAPAGEQAAASRVVVLGSFISSTPEDSAKPVEVISQKDLQEAGSPSIAEFIEQLTSVSPNSANSASTNTALGILTSGIVTMDLRGQGGDGTLVLMNGRRLQSSNGLGGADVNTIPVEALEAVEILKDGASATYGAGAVGGVVNFRTRRDIDAPQITLNKTIYEGSTGVTELNFLTGWVGDAGNIMISLSHEEEGNLMLSDRDFGTVPYLLNPEGYSTASTGQRYFKYCNWMTAANTGGPPANTCNATAASTTPTVLPTLPTTFMLTGNGGGAVQTAAFNDFSDSTPDASGRGTDCDTLGGTRLALLAGANTSGTGGVTTGELCTWPLANVSEIVSAQRQDQAYLEMNTDISDTMEFHFDVLYSKTETTGIRPAIQANVGVRAMDGLINSTVCTGTGGCGFLVPYEVNTYASNPIITTPTTCPVTTVNCQVGIPQYQTTGTATRNPYIDNFNARQVLAGGSVNTIGPGQALLVSSNWRPFSVFGGNPLSPDGLSRSTVQRERFLANVGTKGELAEGTLLGMLTNGATYDIAGSYNAYITTNRSGDLLVNRLQDAMMGYGGAECEAVDRVPTDFTSAQAFNRTIGIQSNIQPGTNGCLWFNPFESYYATSVINGAPNPNYAANTPGLTAAQRSPNWATGSTQAEQTGPAGFTNQRELLEWMWTERPNSNVRDALTFDVVFSGEVPSFELPGGPIGWAAGSQWRQTQYHTSLEEEDTAEREALKRTCPYNQPSIDTPATTARPSSRGCTPATGSGNFFSQSLISLDTSDLQVLAFFGELQLPLLDNLNISLSGRRESFNGGDIVGDIWSVAGKYDITDNLYVRGSYGTNFRAEASLDAIPGQIDFITTTTATTVFSPAVTFQRIQETARGITPEDDSTMNIGIGYQGDLFGGRFRASADFFQIKIDGEVMTSTSTGVIANVFPDDLNGDGINEPDANTDQQLADCSARLISFITFDTPCVQGTTRANMINSVNTYLMNGPGFLTEGVDYVLDYSHPFFDGDLGASFNATQNLTYEVTDWVINGVLFSEGGDRLGYRNGGTRTGSPSQKFRVNGTLRFSNEEHTVSLRANYREGMLLDPGTNGGIVINYTTADGRPDVLSSYGQAKKDYIDYDFNYIYRAPFWKELEFRLSVLNLTDRAPLIDQSAQGLFSSSGTNPRGRRIELGVTKKF